MATDSVEPTVAAKFAAKRCAWAENPKILDTTHRIYLGDAREMRELGDEPCVHLVVTSPPYFDLVEYPTRPTQLGNLPTYRPFLAELRKVWRRSFPLLVPGGRLCIVVGDVCVSRKRGGRHHLLPLHADISRDCVEIGFDYLNPILWTKIANASTEVAGNGAVFLGKPYEPNAVIKNNVEYILIFRKPGAYRKPTKEQRQLSVIDKADHRKWFRQFWSDLPGQSRWRGHPSPFPQELAFRLTSMFSFVGDTVLDPFWGTGSTTAGAMDAHRSSVGYEIEPHYFALGKSRFSQSRLRAHASFISPTTTTGRAPASDDATVDTLPAKQ